MHGELMTVKQTSGSRIRNGGPGLAETVVAHLYDVPMEDLRAATRRSNRAAFARQVAMYLMHVVYGLSLSEVGMAFGRDRTTASYACHRVEDLRDDPLFDHQVAHLESMCRLAAQLEALS